MKFITTILAAFALAMFSGCVTSQDKTDKDAVTKESRQRATRAEFETNMAKWKDAKVADYQFQVDMECFCYPMGWMNITVASGQVAQVDSVPGEVKLFEPQQSALAPTVEYLFDHIDPKLDDSDYTVTVQYDAQFGYPKFIEIKNRGEMHDADFSANVVRLWPSDWIK
jgi:hypothetical protein